MKTIHWIIFAVIVFGSAMLIMRSDGQEPRIDKRIDLNWKFAFDDDSTFKDTHFDDSDWRTVTLPHDWMIELKPAEENISGNAGGFYPGGIGWYRKNLNLSEYSGREKFYLVFDGVYMNADVWVNGIHAGSHKYGYIGFQLDISDLVFHDTVNVIAVRTECDDLPNDRWYSGAGIYRHVRLVAAGKLHFPVFNSAITTFNEKGKRIVRNEITVKNSNRRSRHFKVRSDLLAPDGTLVNTKITSGEVEGKKTISFKVDHQIEHPRLWSDQNPELYEIRSYLLTNKNIIDHSITPFGVRDVVFSPDSGFILNGEKVWLKGVCIHHDGGGLGSAVPDAAWERRLKILKELGVNALRLAHNPHSPEVLDMCDRLGIFVINEMYDKWEMPWNKDGEDIHFRETYESDLSYFIRRDINHPSVIAWSMGNETVEQLHDPESAVEWYTKLADIAKSIDSSRQITCGLHPAYPDRDQQVPSEMIHVAPLVSYNYRTDSFPSWHSQYPEITWLASETKSYNTSRTSEFENISYLDNSWLDMEKFIAGQFIWAGIDYLGESPRWPFRAFYNGLIQTNGFVKPFAYYTQSIYSEDPVVKITVVDKKLVDSLNNTTNWQRSWAGAPVARHWNFEDETEELELIIYTNCDLVTLYLNDTLKTTLEKQKFEDGVIKYRMDFIPGMIRAEGFLDTDNGKYLAVADSLTTSMKPWMIMMKPDKSNLLADGQDIMQIETSVADSSGILHPDANHMISYEVRGPGKIKVIDNGDPTDHIEPSATSGRVYNGKHLVIVQSTLEPGDLTISASAIGLQPASLKVRSKSLKE